MPRWLVAALFTLVIGFVSCCLLFGIVTKVLAYQVPAYDGYVNDFAQVLSPEFETQLEDELREVASASNGAELAVVTIKTLDGDTVENVAQEFFDTWKIGKKGIDNGLLLLVAVDDRKLRIHTGYGTEAVIPDSLAGRIIRDDITPHFKEGDYEAGIEAGVNQLLTYMKDPYAFPGPVEEQEEGSDFWGGVIAALVLVYFVAGFGITIIVYLAAFLARSKSWWLGGAAGLGLGFLFAGIAGGLIFALLGAVLDYILSKNYESWKVQGWSTKWNDTWGGFHSSGSSSSSSSSSSFGGGSSGGGGASGGW